MEYWGLVTQGVELWGLVEAEEHRVWNSGVL